MPADITCTDFDMERAGLSRVCAGGMATIDADLAVKAAACFASANATFSARRFSASRNFDALLSAWAARTASAFCRFASSAAAAFAFFSRAASAAAIAALRLVPTGSGSGPSRSGK